MQAEWNLFLRQLRHKDPFVFNAINTFKLQKVNEKQIRVLYPSDSAKIEFDKISNDFFNHFKTKVGNHSLQLEYIRDQENLKVEIPTKKKIFENFVSKNPLLKDLDDLMNFDLS